MEPICHSPQRFPYTILTTVETVRKGKNGYLNIPCAFDIETTSVYCPKRKTCKTAAKGRCPKSECPEWIEPYAFMYCWQIAIGTEHVCFGRTWEELEYFFKEIEKYCDKQKKLVFYVHNLGFEFQFLKSHFHVENVFARKPRQPMKFTIGNMEFRCSYLLSNMSLEKWCQNTPNVVHGKATGQLDYDVFRTPSTPMTEKEMEYCINDVIAITECLTEYLKEDTIATIPLTSTGFIRRDMYEAIRKNKKERRRFERNRLDVDLYRLCKDTFRGGNTHANHFYTGEILDNLKSKDIASSYPYVMMTEVFPEKFIQENPANIWKYNYPDYSYIGVFRFRNLTFKASHNIPYIPTAKCYSKINSVTDNGRILTADEVIIPLTNIDRDIIRHQYDFSHEEISVFYVARNEYLPTEIRKEILKLFEGKCTLKGIEEKEYEYVKSKNKLNGTYGMMVTDITQDEIVFQNEEWSTQPANHKEALDRYYKNRRSFLSYQHGLWVTAYARRNLEELLNKIGSDVVYCDTDSVKYLGDHEAEVEKINNRILETIRKAPIPPAVKHNGKRFYMGIWEHDGDYEHFITWGAKKYLVVEDGEVQTTVSGLGKKQGAAYFKDHPISDFKPGLVFYPSGRLTAFYNDSPRHVLNISRETFTSGSNMCLMPATYELSIRPEYSYLIENKYCT